MLNFTRGSTPYLDFLHKIVKRENLVNYYAIGSMIEKREKVNRRMIALKVRNLIIEILRDTNVCIKDEMIQNCGKNKPRKMKQNRRFERKILNARYVY